MIQIMTWSKSSIRGMEANWSKLCLGRIGVGFPNCEILNSTCWLGGGQQEMPKPYSQDLRDRVIDAVKRGEMSRRAAARRYEISKSWPSNGLSALNGMARESLSVTAAIAPPS